MTDLVIANARVATMIPSAGDPLGIVPRADVAVAGGRIESISPRAEGRGLPPKGKVIDAGGRVLMPAFVDAHTHAMWAGDRLDEWEMRRRGASYLDLLKAGGGILSTVRAVRRASEAELAEGLRGRLDVMLREGTATVEVKSGYGLTTRDELKMLRAIRAAANGWPGTVVPTALLGHALDPDVPPERFVDMVIDETLPAVHEEFCGIAVDAYCEPAGSGAWPAEACVRLFERAMALGHPVRVHADQFHSLGMVEWSARRGARSVDHLEASSADTLRLLAASATFAVLLPCTGFHTDGRYADGRALVDSGAGDRVVVATNFNPGSSPCSSVALAASLAVRFNGLAPAEALAGCTRNAADLLGLADRGRLAPGLRADLILLRHGDERSLAHDFGGNPVEVVIVGGSVFAGPWVRG